MSATLTVESGPHCPCLILNNSAGENILLNAESDSTDAVQAFASLDSDQRNAVQTIELKVRDEEITARLSRICIVLMGISQRAAAKLAVSPLLLDSASIDIQGNVQTPLSEERVRLEIAELTASHRIDAFAVSGMNSQRNPRHEQQAATIIREYTNRAVLEARFWSDGVSAIERARLATRGAVVSVLLTELLEVTKRIENVLGRTLPVRTTNLDAPLITAMVQNPSTVALAQLGAHESAHSSILQARVTRSTDGYACHCPDGVFEFESITQAKKFAAGHIEELIAAQRKAIGLPESKMQTACEDRYTVVRGKKGPVRVYLESIITGRPESLGSEKTS